MVNQTQSLVLKQSQNLVMTQAMQQSLKILQLSTLDLANFIEAELEKNPLLEAEGENNTEQVESEKAESNESDDENSEIEKDSFEKINSDDIKENDNSLDRDLNSDWSSNEAGEDNQDDYKSNELEYNASNSNAEDDAGTIIEKTFSKDVSLKEHLMEQVTLDFIDPKDKIIAEHIIDMIDASGYLSSETLDEDIENLAEQLGCSVEDVNGIITRLQECDPIGVCSRNLKECLKIQLLEKQTLDTAIEKLLDNLELLAKGEMEKLKKLCAVDADDLKEMIKEIKLLNPRPAVGFSEDKPQTKHADLILEKKNGKWTLELNYELLPKINIRREYYNKIKANKLKGDEKKYVSENYASANFLIRAVQQRCETMLKVGDAIVRHQEKFLEHGINHLKPISMREIALEVELHESTIGRVVANKYIMTPRGVYELKYFFTSSLHSMVSNQDNVSSESVKHQIKEMIENESEVISDDEIAKILKKNGTDIARRTVAKYRESLNIPTSAVRKRLKRING
jgi:RNA polymerase sigma-54 factor